MKDQTNDEGAKDKEKLIPTADAAVGTPGQSATLDPLANDTATQGSALVPSTLALIDNPATGNPVQRVLVAHVGTWAIVNAHIVFTPVAGFTGSTSIDYQVTDTTGRTTSATVTLTYPAVAVGPADPASAPTATRVRALANTGSTVPLVAIALSGVLYTATGALLLMARRRRSSRRTTNAVKA